MLVKVKGNILVAMYMNIQYLGLCLTSMYSSNQETLIKKEILQRYALFNDPKNWYNYVRKLLYDKVKFNRNYYGNFLTDQAKYNINVSSFVWSAHYAFNNIKLMKVKNVIVKPIGRVMMMRRRNTIFMNIVQYALLYNMNKGLSLNITFDYIYFGFGDLHKCFIGYLTLYSKDSKFQYC